MSDSPSTYSAANIKVLEWPEAIRKRPGMYVGSTSQRGLHQLVYEVLDRPVNAVLAGRATRVDVTLMADGRIRVEDDGPGDGGGLGLEGPMTHVRAGVRRRDRRTVDLSYVGAPVANALSSELTAEVRRDGVRWVQEYERGISLAPPSPAGPATASGTTLVFRPDADLFETVECSFDDLLDRFRELAFLNRDLTLTLTDERPRGGAEPRQEHCRFPGGARDFVEFLAAGADNPVHTDILHFEWEDPRLAGTVEVALRWSEGPGAGVRSFANSARTPEGGTHVNGFLDGVAAALGLPEATDHGLTAVVSVKLDDPEFEGATRGLLGGEGVRDGVAEAVRGHLAACLAAHPERAGAVVRRLSGP
ncbi:DNA gyrase subunit B [Streptomyces sp. NPDC051909]|uniref:DNA gyrase subunit B n=1 Tax=Streptomyces sp. NPDC051909 TaxID=3154944 RepID=UPI003424B3F4